MFSSRLDWSARPNPLSELLAEKRRRGDPVLDLTESNPTQAGIEYPTADIARAFRNAGDPLYQPQPFGLPDARAAVAGYYAASGYAVDPARIVLTASTSEAYSYLFKLLANPGDEILIPRPSYPLFEYLAALESVRVVQYPLFYDHGWHLDGAAAAALITSRTRAIVIVHPNNPTGSYVKKHELEELVAMARASDLAIVSDEVFSDYWFERDPRRVGLAAGNSDALTFSLSGLSKIAGLPHMKLGWMVVGGPQRLQQAAMERLELIADTYLSVGTPVQLAAPALIGARVAVQERIRTRLAENLDRLRTALATQSQARLLELEGGWCATLKLPRLHSEQEWVSMLLGQRSVLAQPGFFFDFGAEAFIVVSLLTRPEVFEEGVSRILDLIARE